MFGWLHVAFSAGGLNNCTALLIAGTLFLAGGVSGLSGFAFSAVAACVLWLLPPLQAIPLLMLLSATNQLLSAGSLRHDMKLLSSGEGEGAFPYILGGLAGVPVGLRLLKRLPAAQFACGLGLFLMAYAVFSLLKGSRLRLDASGWGPAVAVGAAGGIVGGFSGFPGSIPVVYLGLQGKTKSETRGVLQPYILTLQVVSLSILAVTRPSIFGGAFWLLFALALPSVLAGTWAGVTLYQRLSDANFRLAVWVLLFVSGTSLVVKSVIAMAHG